MLLRKNVSVENGVWKKYVLVIVLENKNSVDFFKTKFFQYGRYSLVEKIQSLECGFTLQSLLTTKHCSFEALSTPGALSS